MTTANEMLIRTLCKDGCKLNTSTFAKANGTVSHTTLTGITSSAAEINQLGAAGAVKADFVKLHAASGALIASGTQGVHAADLKVNYTTGDLDSEAEIITAINTTNTAINAILARLEAFKINASV